MFHRPVSAARFHSRTGRGAVDAQQQRAGATQSTDFKNDEILFSARPGGHSLVEDVDIAAARLLPLCAKVD